MHHAVDPGVEGRKAGQIESRWAAVEEPRGIDVIGQRVDARKASAESGQHPVRRIGSGAGGDAGIGLGHPQRPQRRLDAGESKDRPGHRLVVRVNALVSANKTGPL